MEKWSTRYGDRTWFYWFLALHSLCLIKCVKEFAGKLVAILACDHTFAIFTPIYILYTCFELSKKKKKRIHQEKKIIQKNVIDFIFCG